MAFDYGKDTLGIKNPFKLEGILELTKGCIILLLGIVLVFSISNDINLGQKSMAWAKLGIAIFFLSWSIKSILKGSFKVFRFLVGRNIPANLSKEKDETSSFPRKAYKGADLAEMLKKRSNKTFVEKQNFISRLLISIMPKFLNLPPAFRIMIEGISAALVETIITFLIFGLGVFAIKTGLLEVIDGKILLEWFGIFLLARLLIVWFKNRPSNPRINSVSNTPFKIKGVIFSIVAAILLPVIIEILLQNGLHLPELGISIVLGLLAIIALGVITVALAFYLCTIRANQIIANTAVSEYKEELQLNMHPKDLFRFFELEMADRRYKELPNRIYRELKPKLVLEGSQNKGNFSGDTIQETQPIYHEMDTPKILEQIRFIAAVTGRVFAIIGCLLLFFKVNSFASDLTFNNIFNTFFYALVLFIFDHYLERIAHIFWAEMLFTSHLVQFFSNGTFSSSKVATGMSVYDSTRSENEIIQTKSTSWIFVGHIISSTIVDSTTHNLEGTRYILEMNKDDNFLTEVIDGLNRYMGKNELIASMKSEKDVENITNIHQFNDKTRALNNNSTNAHIENNRNDKTESLE